MRYVCWQSNTVQNPEIWRILDLSGLTKSVRQSKNCVKSGLVYYNGMRVSSLKQTTTMGKIFLLEVRFPNGIKLDTMMVFYQDRNTKMKSRHNYPFQTFYKG